ncbi:MAG: hypothetical protein ACSW8A_02815, partial [Lachnospiraceae bacterium]
MNNYRIDQEALFSDESASFRVPEEPDTGDLLLVRFRTRKDEPVKVILWVSEDTDEETMTPVAASFVMEKTGAATKDERFDRQFDFYESRIPVSTR